MMVGEDSNHGVKLISFPRLLSSPAGTNITSRNLYHKPELINLFKHKAIQVKDSQNRSI